MMNRDKGLAHNSGITLIELLIAMVLVGLIVAMGSRTFLQAKAQSILRGRESDLLAQSIRLRHRMEPLLEKPDLTCKFRTVWQGDNEAVPMWLPDLKKTFSNLDSLTVTCEVLGPNGNLLSSKEGYPARLLWAASLHSGPITRHVSGVALK